ncbi:carbohydrate kinase [Salicibibacter cibi]|uniref:Carbohydrate kinase n=1 Tax=Salicibibacter cibi TaxID=2743001 RepID=A0A7T6ZDB5_9BACI|nr:carbohydrate kinase [Salicibibacter cibi]QQK81428.1 carbohydrate kinase [Salicibibacter cibi]
MNKIISIGEALIDMSPMTNTEKPSFQANIGGAPLNVLSALAKWGVNTSYIGKVGDDLFGEQILEKLNALNIDTSAMQMAEHTKTTLAFVSLKADGERSFDFYRSPGADQLLQPSDLDMETIGNADIIHFGSVSLSHEPSRSANFQALDFAAEQGIIVSYDPNLRLALWENEKEARKVSLEAARYADILKISREELLFLTEEKKVEDAITHFKNISLIFVTLGAKGCYYYGENRSGFSPPHEVSAIDSTGAGDAFMASVLFGILRHTNNINHLTNDGLEKIATFANHIAAHSTTRSGGFDVVKGLDEIPPEHI